MAPLSRSRSATHDPRPTVFSEAIGRSRYIVLLAVIAVMVVAISLFLLGTLQAGISVWNAWAGVARGELATTDLTVTFLEIVSVMLKAVVFYLIGVGLYSLFIAPLNLTVSLGVETLSDLESKVISVVIVILAVTFLEHFILWEQPFETLQFGAALAIVTAANVLFQMHSHKVKEDQQSHHPDVQTRAQRDLFQENREEHDIKASDVENAANQHKPGDQDDGQPRQAEQHNHHE